MGLGFRVLDFGVLGFSFRFCFLLLGGGGWGCRVLGFRRGEGLGVLGGFGIKGAGIQGLGLRVWGGGLWGFRNKGLGFRIVFLFFFFGGGFGARA